MSLGMVPMFHFLVIVVESRMTRYRILAEGCL